MDCISFGIPEYLHRKGRPEDQNFSPEEKIYRRVPFIDPQSKQQNIITENGIKKLSLSIFKTDKMSCNRERFSTRPEDVLYDCCSSNHYPNYGIVELTVKDIEDIAHDHPEIKNLKYTLKVNHSPEECIYPHTEVFIRENEVVVQGDIKPKSIKTYIKATYRDACKIVCEPKSET